MMYRALLTLMLAGCLVPPLVQGCSCPTDASDVNRTEVIRADFNSSYRPDVYTAMVVAATCNCIPGDETSSSSLNCQRYRLDSTQGTVNATVVSRGECQSGEYSTDGFPFTHVCAALNSRLVMRDQQVEGPVPPGGELPVRDLTLNEACSYVCPFNGNSTDPNFIQPCVYTVRVREVFKGNYSVNEELFEVTGPDVLTTCGNSVGFVLQISTEYLVGIGGACSPIDTWSELSSYSPEELELLRELSTGGEVMTTTVTMSLGSPVATVTTSSATDRNTVCISVVMMMCLAINAIIFL